MSNYVHKCFCGEICESVTKNAKPISRSSECYTWSKPSLKCSTANKCMPDIVRDCPSTLTEEIINFGSPVSSEDIFDLNFDEIEDHPPYTPADLVLKEPLPELPPRASQVFNHPGPDKATKEYEIESVVARAKIWNGKMWEDRFLVRWIGWEDRFNTFELESTLRSSKALFNFFFPGVVFSAGASCKTKTLPILESTPINSGNGQFNGILQSELTRYIEEGKYSKLLGFHSYSKDDVQNIELQFWSSLYSKWSSLEMGDFYLCPKIVGRTQDGMSELSEFMRRHPEHRSKFISNNTDVLKAIRSLSRKYRFVIFLLIGPLGTKNSSSGLCFHTNVLIVSNDGARRTYHYYNPLVRGKATQAPVASVRLARTNLPVDGERSIIQMAFGDQSSTHDCLERALTFIANTLENSYWIEGLEWLPYDCVTMRYINN